MQTLIWLGLLEGLWLAMVPSAFLLFRWLPDRGFSVSPALGLLSGAYLTWLLASLGLTLSPLVCWAVTLGSFGLLNGWLLWRRKRALLKQLVAFGRARWRILLGSQVAFGICFGLLMLVRYYRPDIRNSEKFGNYTIYNSLLNNPAIPPPDLWFAGYPVNNYYFSHVMMAYLTRLSGIYPAVVYNLFLCTIFGLLGAGAFGLGYNLLGKTRRKWVGLAVGVLAVVFICFAGNLDSFRQLIAPNRHDIDYCRPGSTQCYWWTPARVIYDVRTVRNSQGIEQTVEQETINEFPAFSFLLGDVHPHIAALPFVLLAWTIILNLWHTPRPVFYRISRYNLASFGLSALILGTAIFLNSINYPTIFLPLAGALVWQTWRTGKPRWGRLGLYLAGLFLASLVVVAPFLLNFHSFAGQSGIPATLDYPLLRVIGKNIGLVQGSHTSLQDHLLIYGLFDYALVYFLALKLWPYCATGSKKVSRTSFVVLAGWVAVVGSQLLAQYGPPNLLPGVGLGLVGLGLLAVGLWRAARQRNKPVLLVSGWAGLVVAGFVLKVETLGLLLVALMTCALLLWYENRAQVPHQRLATVEPLTEVGAKADNEALADRSEGFVSTRPRVLNQTNPVRAIVAAAPDTFILFMVGFAALLLLTLEFFYVRDITDNRFNIGKFYIQIWLILGLAAAYACGRLWLAAGKVRLALFLPGAVGLVALLFCTLIYPVKAANVVTANFTTAKDLNGEAWLKRVYPGDYSAINWLHEQAARNPDKRGVLLELSAPDYTSDAGRISVFSGYPAVIGWPELEGQRHGFDPAQRAEVQRRYAQASGPIYKSDDRAKTEQFLRDLKVKYVYVGVLEHKLGASEAELAKFGQFMNLVYDHEGVQIYAFS